jgi:thimet oligopeptidase
VTTSVFFRRPAAAVVAACLLALPPAMPVAAPLPAGLPLDGRLTSEAIAATCRDAVAVARGRIDAILRQPGPRTFANVTAPLEDAESDLNDSLAAQQFLDLVAPDPDVRRASARCGTAVGDLFGMENARPDLYAALLAARAGGTAATPAQRKLEALDISGMQRSGAGLAPAARREFLVRERTLSDLANAFAADVANDTTTIAIGATQAAALPGDFVATLGPGSAGGYVVPVNESTAATFMANESDAAARRAYYVAYYRRGGPVNVAFLQQALRERERVARLLGYRNWSAYVSADRMAGTPANVDAFLKRLDGALLPQARAEYAQLAALKGAPLEPWDVTYYQSRLRRARYGVDRDVVRSYFPAPHVVAAVLALYARVFGVTFTPAPDLPRWDPAVQAYDVTDTATGTSRGTFYLDLYARPGKLDRFANATLRARRVLAGGGVRPAVNAILGSWAPGAPGQPALLSHEDVIAFVHEFGHNVAALLADTPYETLNGGFRLDFIEAPAEMMETFAWEPAVLAQLSANVATGRPLPARLIARMIAARGFDAAYASVLQIFYAAVDQRFHTLPSPVATTAVWKRTFAELTPGRFVDGTIPQASFAHLMNGYEGGYYAYLWSQVDAQDLFAAFRAAGLENPRVGRRFRDDVLAPARTFEPDVEVRRFLGRPVDPHAFYRALGIRPKSGTATIR